MKYFGLTILRKQIYFLLVVLNIDSVKNILFPSSLSTNKSYKCYLVIRLDVQEHPRKPHSGFVLPQFVPVDQPGRMF